MRSRVRNGSSLPVIHQYQNELALCEMRIHEITASKQDLRAKKMIAAEKLGLSFSGFMLSAGGVAISALSIVLVAGAVSFAPYVAPLLLCLSLALTLTGMVYFAHEKISEYRQWRAKKELLNAHSEHNLDAGIEALFNPETRPKSSSAFMMEALLSNEPPLPSPEPYPKPSEPKTLPCYIPKEDSVLLAEEADFTPAPPAPQ